MASCYGIREFGSGRATAILRRFTRRHSGSQGARRRPLQSCRPMESAAGICFRSKDSPRPLALHSAPVRSLTLFGFRAVALCDSTASLELPSNLALLATIPFIVVHGRSWREGFPIWMTGLLVWVLIQRFLICSWARMRCCWPSCSRFVFGSLKREGTRARASPWPGTHQVPTRNPFFADPVDLRKETGIARICRRPPPPSLPFPLPLVGWRTLFKYPVIY